MIGDLSEFHANLNMNKEDKQGDDAVMIGPSVRRVKVFELLDNDKLKELMHVTW